MRRRGGIIALLMAVCMAVLPVNAEESRFIGEFAPRYEAEEEVRTADASSVGCSNEGWEVLYITNKIRMINGLQPLSVTANMQYAANVRAKEIQTLFDHTRPDGTSCFTALEQAGVSYGSAGENIAAGQTSPQEVIDAWWASDGHRSNMLGSDYTHLAVGYGFNGNLIYKHYWVQMFVGECSPTSISIDQEKDYTYLLEKGEIIDDLGLMLKVECKHGTSYMPLTSELCGGYDETKMYEEQNVTVNFKGATTTFPIYICDPMPFTDVSPSAWYYNYVSNVYYNGIMTGLNQTTFGPDKPLARAQFSVILHRLNGAPEMYYIWQFPDVAPGMWYTDAILWANSTGVVNGYSDTGLFGPGDNINREQMAVMMYRYAKYQDYDVSQKADFSQFVDASRVNSFAEEAMQWAVGTGIITGKDNGTKLDPQGNASRAECATIITRFLQLYN